MKAKRGLGSKPKLIGPGGGGGRGGYGKDIFGAGGGLMGMQRPVHGGKPAATSSRPKNPYSDSPKQRQAEAFKSDVKKSMAKDVKQKSTAGKKVLQIAPRF